MTYDNPRMEMVHLAYKEQASMVFQVQLVNGDEVCKAARIMGKYNAFGPRRLKNFVDQLPAATFIVGREYSPVVYVKLTEWWVYKDQLATVRGAAESARIQVDEMTTVIHPVIGECVRLWWD